MYVYVNRISKLQGTILKLVFLCLGLVGCLYLLLIYEFIDDLFKREEKKKKGAASSPCTMLGTGRLSTDAFTQVHSLAGEAGT